MGFSCGGVWFFALHVRFLLLFDTSSFISVLISVALSSVLGSRVLDGLSSSVGVGILSLVCGRLSSSVLVRLTVGLCWPCLTTGERQHPSHYWGDSPKHWLSAVDSP